MCEVEGELTPDFYPDVTAMVDLAMKTVVFLPSSPCYFLLNLFTVSICPQRHYHPDVKRLANALLHKNSSDHGELSKK